MRIWLAGGLLAAFAWTAHAEERRELGAHEHGHAKLNLAVEADAGRMEIAAPGMDVLGFEHPAETDAGQGGGRRRQGRPWPSRSSLFVLPAAAGCRVVEAAVTLEQERARGEEGEGEAHADGDHERSFTASSPAATRSTAPTRVR